MASSFPKLPGYYPTQSLELNPNYKRVSWGKQEQAANNKNEPIPEYILPRVGESWSPDQTRSLNENYMSTSHLAYRPTSFLPEITEHFSPSWVKMDKHVLRFYGYFRESVVESSIETHRVRKLVIYYYLVDGTLNIAEPKNTNTGIVQGAFLKRQRVLKADGSGKFLNPNDFRIGQEVVIYGKNILINNCDPYTREFYEKQGSPQGAAFDTPQDNFEIMSNTKHIPQKDQTMRDFMEAKLGGGKVASQKQFLTHDRKVLKFFVYSEIPYIMHYYLADDTLEIREVNFNNSGRDPFPLLLKRQKLPKRFNLNQPGQSNEEEYIRPHDIVNGEVIEIFGRKFRVEGCDLFTQNYYKEKYDVDFPLGKVERARPQEYKAPLLPPYNGFGTEEDSLSYVNRIIPKVPQKDYFKWMDNQSYLRFYVRFNTRQPEDVQRRFIVTLFLHDDTLLVYEPEQRNSGITGGKFLEKGRYKNVDNGGAYIGVTDLLVGKDVKINGFSFNVIDCDEFTRKWLFEKLGISETGKVLALANTGPLNGTRSHAMLRQSV